MQYNATCSQHSTNSLEQLAVSNTFFHAFWKGCRHKHLQIAIQLAGIIHARPQIQTKINKLNYHTESGSFPAAVEDVVIDNKNEDEVEDKEESKHDNEDYNKDINDTTGEY